MADSKKRLALAICDFLRKSATDGTLPADEKESVETAVECIADSFKVDASDPAAVSEAVGSQSLLNVFDAYVKLEGAAKAASASGSAGGQATTGLSAEQKKEAEGLKSKGNAAMQQKNFTLAVDLYTQALDLHPNNSIYLSNRSAAYHNLKNFEAAKRDAKACTDADPSYPKGWSRLGLALYALGEARASMEAYKKGMEVEGSGGSDAMRKGFQAAKKRVEELEAAGEIHEPDRTPREDVDVDLGPAPRQGSGGAGGGSGNPFADLLGGGAGGSGGGPDFASMMNNPMFQNMAQSMMNNPDMMAQLMSNPRLREMANSFSQGGGLPDMSQLMNDPNIAEIARSLMGGGGGPGSTGGPGGANTGNTGN